MVPNLALLQQNSISRHFQFQSISNFSTDVRNMHHKLNPIDKTFPFMLASYRALELMDCSLRVYRLKAEKYFTKFALTTLIYGRIICQIC